MAKKKKEPKRRTKFENRYRIIIDIRDQIPDSTVLERVWKVIDNGLLSGEKLEDYAYATLFKDGIMVEYDPKHKAEKFIVYKDKRKRKNDKK